MAVAGLGLEPYHGGAFDYNEKIPIETSQFRYKDFWIRPIGGTENQAGPFNIRIDATAYGYIQLSLAGLELKLRVIRGDGGELHPLEDIVAPVNLLGATLFDSVEVYLNGVPFSGASSLGSGYKALIDTMFSYDSDSRNTHLNSQFFFLDTPGLYGSMRVSDDALRQAYIKAVKDGIIDRPTIPDDIKLTDEIKELLPRHFDDVNYVKVIKGFIIPAGIFCVEDFPELDKLTKPQQEDCLKRWNVYLAHYKDTMTKGTLFKRSNDYEPYNKGFDARWRVVGNSRHFDTYAPISHDFFKMNNHLGPGNKVDIVLHRAKDNFLLNTWDDDVGYKLEILDMKLHLRYIERHENVPTPMIEKYLMNETQIHKQVVNKKSPSTSFRIFSGGIMPKTVVLGMVRTMALEGNYQLNPWNFEHFDVSSILLNLNGTRYPVDILTPDFSESNAKISRVYRWLFENSGSYESDKGNLISWNAFKAGCFLIPFDLTPDKCNGLHNHDGEVGYIDVELNFRVPLPYSIYVLYELVFPKVIINNKSTGEVIALDVSMPKHRAG